MGPGLVDLFLGGPTLSAGQIEPPKFTTQVTPYI